MLVGWRSPLQALAPLLLTGAWYSLLRPGPAAERAASAPRAAAERVNLQGEDPETPL